MAGKAPPDLSQHFAEVLQRLLCHHVLSCPLDTLACFLRQAQAHPQSWALLQRLTLSQLGALVAASPQPLPTRAGRPRPPVRAPRGGPPAKDRSNPLCPPVVAAPIRPSPEAALVAAEQALAGGQVDAAIAHAEAGLRACGALGTLLLLERTYPRPAARARSLLMALWIQVEILPSAGTKGAPAPVLPAHPPEPQETLPSLLLVGGIGRMARKYLALAQSMGYRLHHVERARDRSTGSRPAAILVITTVVSHPLREYAAQLAAQRGIPIHYLPEPSLTAVRRALESLSPPTEACA